MPTPFAAIRGGSPEPALVTTDSYALAAEHEVLQPSLIVRPWLDPVVDTIGFDVRSVYAETFYLPVVGPPTTAYAHPWWTTTVIPPEVTHATGRLGSPGYQAGGP